MVCWFEKVNLGSFLNLRIACLGAQTWCVVGRQKVQSAPNMELREAKAF